MSGLAYPVAARLPLRAWAACARGCIIRDCSWRILHASEQRVGSSHLSSFSTVTPAAVDRGTRRWRSQGRGSRYRDSLVEHAPRGQVLSIGIASGRKLRPQTLNGALDRDLGRTAPPCHCQLSLPVSIVFYWCGAGLFVCARSDRVFSRTPRCRHYRPGSLAHTAFPALRASALLLRHRAVPAARLLRWDATTAGASTRHTGRSIETAIARTALHAPRGGRHPLRRAVRRLSIDGTVPLSS